MGLFFAFAISIASALLLLHSTASQAVKLRFALAATAVASLGVCHYVACWISGVDAWRPPPIDKAPNDCVVIAATWFACYFYSTSAQRIDATHQA
jgi:hypothetical protein